MPRSLPRPRSAATCAVAIGLQLLKPICILTSAMANARDAALSRDQIRSRIRQAGLRATLGRIATYEALHVAAAPLTHADVVAKLSSIGLDRATVYRNLTDLTEAGLVARSDLGDHAWRFELSHAGPHDSEHVHFVCIDCGEVACLPGVGLEVSAVDVPRAVSQQRVEVQLRGRCDDCSEEAV
jgi:Fur family transcriptional regulator, ferric uptake regulator